MVLLFGFKEVFVFFALPSVVVVAVVAVIYLTYCRQQYEKSVVGVPKPYVPYASIDMKFAKRGD